MFILPPPTFALFRGRLSREKQRKKTVKLCKVNGLQLIDTRAPIQSEARTSLEFNLIKLSIAFILELNSKRLNSLGTVEILRAKVIIGIKA